MADMPNTARRTLLKAVPFMGVAGLLPVIAEASPAQSAAERARHHWAEFAKAMDELTADANGWRVDAGSRHAFGDTVPGGQYLKTSAVRHVKELMCIWERVEPFSINV